MANNIQVETRPKHALNTSPAATAEPELGFAVVPRVKERSKRHLSKNMLLLKSLLQAVEPPGRRRILWPALKLLELGP